MTVTTEMATSPDAEAIEALFAELGLLQAELAALRVRLRSAQQATLKPRDVQLCENALQWVSIAVEMEMKRDGLIQQSGGRASTADLGAARDSICSKLDRLRAAGRADGVSE